MHLSHPRLFPLDKEEKDEDKGLGALFEEEDKDKKWQRRMMPPQEDPSQKGNTHCKHQERHEIHVSVILLSSPEMLPLQLQPEVHEDCI